MSGMITRDDAVEVCQSYGFSTADGWSDSKVQKKLRELIQLYRSGDWEPDSDDDEDGKLLELMQQMANATKDGEEAVIRTKEEIDEEDAAEKEVVEGCPVSVGDRGIVVESDGIKWKGMVKKLLSLTHALIMDQDGETWDVDVSTFKVKIKAADVKTPKTPELMAGQSICQLKECSKVYEYFRKDQKYCQDDCRKVAHLKKKLKEKLNLLHT